MTPDDPTTLSAEAESIARAFEARQAELDAIEADPYVAGSEAEAAYYWEHGGEWPDDTHALDLLRDGVIVGGQPGRGKARPADEIIAACRNVLPANDDTAPKPILSPWLRSAGLTPIDEP